ncbi:MAG: FAD-dependent oxidoreductase [Christensenellaceae bacterium]|nr:FAD-dependent oxidoreductase [Christensenellaceae bacterium]
MPSIWEQEVSIEPRAALEEKVDADVCVIGAGLAGLNCARLLSEAGARVVVLEAERIAGGQTARTTGKISAGQEIVYSKLGKHAVHYAEAQRMALERYRQLAKQYDFALEQRDHYLFALEDGQPLREELEAMREAGLDAFWADETELKLSLAGAVGLGAQACFHPLRYARAIAEGLTIYEHSRALHVTAGRVATARGEVRAPHIIVATNYPFINAPGLYFLHLRQSRSFAAAIEGVPPPEAMHLDAAPGGLSIRPYGRYTVILIGDEPTGHNEGTQFARLDQWIAQLYPGARVAARWSAQDAVSADHLPYAGRYAPGAEGLYVATGFRKWGMTGSMAAAIALTDLIRGREPPDWTRAFDPARSPLGVLPGVLEGAGAAVQGLSARLIPPDASQTPLTPGEARVMLWEGRAAAVYRDKNGHIHLASPACTHMGCRLNWNADDITWDCPCHGSRFDVDGRLLDGPAQRDAEVAPDA